MDWKALYIYIYCTWMPYFCNIDQQNNPSFVSINLPVWIRHGIYCVHQIPNDLHGFPLSLYRYCHWRASERWPGLSLRFLSRVPFLPGFAPKRVWENHKHTMSLRLEVHKHVLLYVAFRLYRCMDTSQLAGGNEDTYSCGEANGK